MPAQQTEWTAEMVRGLPDDGNRYEVLDGEIPALQIDLREVFGREE